MVSNLVVFLKDHQGSRCDHRFYSYIITHISLKELAPPVFQLIILTAPATCTTPSAFQYSSLSLVRFSISALSSTRLACACTFVNQSNDWISNKKSKKLCKSILLPGLSFIPSSYAILAKSRQLILQSTIARLQRVSSSFGSTSRAWRYMTAACSNLPCSCIMLARLLMAAWSRGLILWIISSRRAVAFSNWPMCFWTMAMLTMAATQFKTYIYFMGSINSRERYTLGTQQISVCAAISRVSKWLVSLIYTAPVKYLYRINGNGHVLRIRLAGAPRFQYLRTQKILSTVRFLLVSCQSTPGIKNEDLQ